MKEVYSYIAMDLTRAAYNWRYGYTLRKIAVRCVDLDEDWDDRNRA